MPPSLKAPALHFTVQCVLMLNIQPSPLSAVFHPLAAETLISLQSLPHFAFLCFPIAFFFVSAPCSFLSVSLLFFRFCSLLLMFHHYCSNAVQCTALNGLFSPCKMEQNKLKKTSYASVLNHSLDQSGLPL